MKPSQLHVAALSALGLSTLLVLGAGCSKGQNAAPPPPVEVTVPAGARVPVMVDARGYHPATIHASVGSALTLVFTRTSDEGCGQQVVFPSLNIQKDLPLNQAVEVSVPGAAGTLAFTCSMNMLRGSVVVQ